MDGVFDPVVPTEEDEELLRRRKIEQIRRTRAMRVAKGHLRREQILENKPHLANCVRKGLYDPQSGRRVLNQQGTTQSVSLPPNHQETTSSCPQPHHESSSTRSSSCASTVEFYSTNFRPARVIEEFAASAPRQASEVAESPMTIPRWHIPRKGDMTYFLNQYPRLKATRQPISTFVDAVVQGPSSARGSIVTPLQAATPTQIDVSIVEVVKSRSVSPLGAGASITSQPPAMTAAASCTSRPQSASYLRPGSAAEMVVLERRRINEMAAAAKEAIDKQHRFIELFSKRELPFSLDAGATSTVVTAGASSRRPQSARERPTPTFNPAASTATNDVGKDSRLKAAPARPNRPSTATPGRPPLTASHPQRHTPAPPQPPPQQQHRSSSSLSDVVPLSERAFVSRPASASLSRPPSSVALHLRSFRQQLRAASNASSVAPPSTIAAPHRPLTLDLKASHREVTDNAPPSSRLPYPVLSTTAEHFLRNSPRRASYTNHHRNATAHNQPTSFEATPIKKPAPHPTEESPTTCTPQLLGASANLRAADRAEIMAAFGDHFEPQPKATSNIVARPSTAATRLRGSTLTNDRRGPATVASGESPRKADVGDEGDDVRSPFMAPSLFD